MAAGLREMRLRRLVICALAAGWLGLVPAGAEAGFYDVRSCDTAPNHAWELSGTNGFMARAACPPLGDPNAGISTRINAEVDVDTEERATFRAPAGTTISDFYWDGRVNRDNCSWKIAIQARPSDKKLVGELESGGPTGACFVGIDPPGWHPTPAGTTAITQVAKCRFSPRCPPGAAVHSFKTVVRIQDATPPALAITGGGLASGHWVRGDAAVVFDRWDSTGIGSSRLQAGAAQVAGWAHPGCDFSRVAPCESGNAAGAMLAPATPLGEGAQTLSVVVTDTAGNEGAAPFVAYVDNTPPARRAPDVAGGAGWRSKPGVELTWSNADELTPTARPGSWRR